MASIYETGSTGMHKVYEPTTKSYLSWRAIFAGSIIALSVQLLLSVLGMGLGLRIINPEVEQTFGFISGVAGIWMLITTIISLFVGGWFASRFSGAYETVQGVLHSLVSWGVATLVSFYLMTTAFGSVLSGFLGAIGRWVSMTSVGMVSVTPQTAVQAMDAVSRASMWAFFTLILGAVSAAVGGWLGVTEMYVEAKSTGVEEEGKKEAA